MSGQFEVVSRGQKMRVCVDPAQEARTSSGGLCRCTIGFEGGSNIIVFPIVFPFS